MFDEFDVISSTMTQDVSSLESWCTSNERLGFFLILSCHQDSDVPYDHEIRNWYPPCVCTAYEITRGDLPAISHNRLIFCDRFLKHHPIRLNAALIHELQSEETMTNEPHGEAGNLSFQSGQDDYDRQHAIAETPVFDLFAVTQRCRVDLDFMDLLLEKLERGPSLLTAGAAVPPSSLTDPTSDGQPCQFSSLEADLVRRLADHIEDLYRLGPSISVLDLMSELQSKMVRCLQLAPARLATAKAS